MASLEPKDLDAGMITAFLDHLETARSNSATTRNCRRAAIRSFFRHLVRKDLAHAQQYTQVLAIPAKKSRHRPAAYLEPTDVRAIIAHPDRRTVDGWRDYTLLLFLYNSGARVSEAAGLRWSDLQLAPSRQVRLGAKASGSGSCRCGERRPMPCIACAADRRKRTINNTSFSTTRGSH
jgi:integrase